MGDPGGIGPEVIVKALADEGLRERGTFLLLGLGSCMERAATAAGVAPFWSAVAPDAKVPSGPGVVLVDDEKSASAPPRKEFAAEDSALGGRLSLEWVERAVKIAKGQVESLPRADAIVTGPVSKRSWALAG